MTEGGVVDLGSNVHFLGQVDFGCRVFVRPCYPPLLDLVLQGERKVLLRGTPGIGKTHFSLLLILRLIAEGKTVVYQRRDGLRSLLFTPTEVKSASTLNLLDSELGKLSTFFVVDALDPAKVNAKTILVSSPNKGNFREYVKDAPDAYFMPPWSLEEILECNRLVGYGRTVAELRDGFEKVGGVPRYLLTKTPAAGVAEVKEAISGTGNLAWKEVEHSLVTKGSVSGKVLHLIPGADFKTFEFRFASRYVEDQIFEIAKEGREQDLCRLISDSSELGETGGVRGVLFERVAHLRLAQGGEFSIRSLDGKSKDVKLCLGGGERKKFSDLSEIKGFSDGEYLVPKSSNLESVDSLVRPNLMFQMTVSASHPCKQAGLKNAIDALRGLDPSGNASKRTKIQYPPARLIFVVPAYMEEKKEGKKMFQAQRYTDAKGNILAQPTYNDVYDIQQFVLPIRLT